MIDYEFWDYVDQLVRGSRIDIDRPRGTASSQRGGKPYPVDYGYLAGTTGSDGAGIDVWAGSGDRMRISGTICTVDLLTRTTELKIMLGCTMEEMQAVVEFIDDDNNGLLFLSRPE